MSIVWFVYSNEIVSGPLNTEQVQENIASGLFPSTSFIWWKGQVEWTPIEQWNAGLATMVGGQQPIGHQPTWHIDFGTSTMGPVTQVELIENLRDVKDMSQIRLWSPGMSKWTSIFELREIMELIGLSRRENQRAPLMGQVAVNRSSQDPKGFVMQAASISIGGIGLTGPSDLKRGDQVSLLVKSNELAGSLHLKGEVVYIKSDGYVGVRFHKVHPETQSLIYDYVKQFSTDKTIVNVKSSSSHAA